MAVLTGKERSVSSFFRFPTDPELKSKWIAAIRRKIGLPTSIPGSVVRILLLVSAYDRLPGI